MDETEIEGFAIIAWNIWHHHNSIVPEKLSFREFTFVCRNGMEWQG